MPHPLIRGRREARRPLPGIGLAAAAMAALALGGCFGGGNDDDELPRLSAAEGAEFQGDCDTLAARLSALADTEITATTSVAAGTLTIGGEDVPAHCLVTGKVNERTSAVDGNTYAISFEMRLPLDWNGRFFHQGNGGIDGNVVTATGSSGGGPLTHALMKGFAVLSSDAGHASSLGATFGIDPQARLDYGYQAVGTLTPLAKQIIDDAYGKPPDRSYFGGCSNGGRHTFVAASRYADQYDGFLAGAPGYRLPLAALANIFGAQRYATVATDASDLSTAFTAAERATVASAVLAKCDALDGVTDGLVQDVEACRAAFSLNDDVPTCSADRDGTCLSAAQKTAIAPIFSGATDGNGDVFYRSFPYDSGLGAGGIAFWEFTAPVLLDSGAVGLIFKVPPEDPATFNGPAFSLGADIDEMLAQLQATNATYTESSFDFMMPPDPTDLATLRNRGAKIMVYHGVSDPIFSVDDTTAWYDGLNDRWDGHAEDFARFYRIPGMGHCSGGPATDQFDMLTKLVDWVERGEQPQEVIATARGAGNAGGENAEVPGDWAADRTRPLCPYPKVARYVGSGDVEDAASFSCEE